MERRPAYLGRGREFKKNISIAQEMMHKGCRLQLSTRHAHSSEVSNDLFGQEQSHLTMDGWLGPIKGIIYKQVFYSQIDYCQNTYMVRCEDS